MRPMGSAEGLEARRRLAAVLLDRGESVQSVAGQLLASPRSVRRWQQRYRLDGLRGLDARKRCRGSKLDGLRTEIEHALLESPRESGCAGDEWTCRLLVDLVKRRFGVTCHQSTMSRWLKSQGWSTIRGRAEGRRKNADTREPSRTLVPVGRGLEGNLMMVHKSRVSVYIPTLLVQRLRGIAEGDRRTVSELVAVAVYEFLTRSFGNSESD